MESGLKKRRLSRPIIASIAIVLIALLIFIPSTFLPLGSPLGDYETNLAKLNPLFETLPPLTKTWMSFQHGVFLSSVLFVFWFKEARVYLLGIVASHLIHFGQNRWAPVERIDLGLVALNHMVWIPALVLLVISWPALKKKSLYSIWYHIAIFQMTVSLSFDIPNSAIYLFG